MESQNGNIGIIDSGAKRPESINTCYRNLTVCPVVRRDGRLNKQALRRRDIPKTVVARFHGKYQKTPSCWLWTAGRFARGYGMVNLGRFADGRQQTIQAHRVAYVLAHGDIPQGFVVMHTCDVCACVNPDHLVLGTQGDNVRDASRKGKYLRGRTVGSVRWIREQRRLGVWPKRGKPVAAYMRALSLGSTSLRVRGV